MNDVRRADEPPAVMALGNIELPAPAGGSVRLNDEASRLFYQVFIVETDRAVRFEIVKAFALAGQNSNITRDIIARALDESDESILQYAIMGVATLQAPELLPRVITHLQDPSVAVRLAAVTTVGRLGAVDTYRKQLEKALAEEKREEIKQVLRSAITSNSQ